MAGTLLWANLKAISWKFVGGLVLEEKEGTHVISIGRFAFSVVFAVMLIHWARYHGQQPTPVPLPDGVLEAFYALLGYIASGKVAQALQTRRGAPMAPPPGGESAP